MNWDRPTDVKLNPMAWITSFPVAKKVISLLTDRDGKRGQVTDIVLGINIQVTPGQKISL